MAHALSTQILVEQAKVQNFARLYVSLPFDDPAGVEFGNTCARLRLMGTPIGPCDLMIASIAKVNQLILVTHNTNELGAAFPAFGWRIGKSRESNNRHLLGRAHTVTGSMHLVEAGRQQLLLDCGLFQGKRAEAWQRNKDFPFAPSDIDAVVLSHAHIDHCGNLPNLVRRGFRGADLLHAGDCATSLPIMLADSAKIQEEDADHLNRHRQPGEIRSSSRSTTTATCAAPCN